MFVWNDSSQKLREAYVVAIIPQCSSYGIMNVIGPYNGVGSGYNSYYAHCAEIPEEPKPRWVTIRELAKWCAQGNGQIQDADRLNCVFTGLDYGPECDDHTAPDNYKVRKWDDTEWHEPTAEYLGLEA